MKRSSALCFAFLSCVVASASWATGCEQYLSEAEARAGVVLRLEDDGRVRSVLTHGEATFSAPTANLVATARRNAELDAKRALAEWLSVDVSAETLSRRAIDEVSLTDDAGATRGAVAEFASVVDIMRSQTEATLSGVVKLDECVDPAAGVALVTMGWKPSFLNTAASPAPPAENADASTPPRGGGLTFVTLTVDGFGPSQKDAVNDGLRLAVSQVFGESFASEMSTAGVTLSTEITETSGTSSGVVVDQQASAVATRSATSGVIHSYRIREKTNQGSEVRVTLEVELPKYEPVDTDTRLKIVVVPPTALDQSIPAWRFPTLAGSIRRELESLINETRRLSVLDRSSSAEVEAELRRMSGPAYGVAEFARFGNRLGADYLLITELGRFNEESSVKMLAGKRVDRLTLGSTAWIKVVDVASGNMVFSQGIPMSLTVMERPGTLEIFARRHAHALALPVAATLGGGLTPAAEARVAKVRDTVNSYAEAAERVAADREEIREKAADDW